MKTGIVGGSGYAGGELIKLLSVHPKFEITYISAGTSAGEEITSIHPHLFSFAGQKFSATNLKDINECEIVFLALPHGESAKLVNEISKEVKVVDLGADFRLSSRDKWQKYYGGNHAGKFTYGLPEIHGNRDLIAKTNRLANPGCYATAISLACAPALDAGIIEGSDIVVVAASGTTGAGRTAKVNLLGSEVMNSLTSYKFGGVHQHTPEIEEVLSGITGSEIRISFTPILAPMPRGILATVTAKLSKDMRIEEAHKIFRDYFTESDFVEVLPLGKLPQTSSVNGTNKVAMQIAVDEHTKRIVVSCAIDNLGKGAAGQAIQNANLMCGFIEGAGLWQIGVK